MFLKSVRDQQGFWDTFNATNSTIDWCESNYTVSYYVAEWQNSISSLWITFGGLIALYWAISYNHPRSIQVVSLLITIVGLGSTIFHGTLLYFSQMLDELPMMWAMMSLFYIYLQVALELSEAKKKWYQSLSTTSPLKQHVKIDINDKFSYLKQFIPLKPFYYISLAIDGTILSTIFTYSIPLTMLFAMFLFSLIHSAFGFVIVFQGAFLSLTLASASIILEIPKPFKHLLTSDQSRLAPHHTATLTSYRLWYIYYICCAIIAFICWNIDNIWCSSMLGLPIYVSGHAIWHFFNYLATYSAVVLATYATQMTQGAEVDEFELNNMIQLSSSAEKKLLLTEDSLPLLHQGVKEINLVSDTFVTPLSPLIAIDNQFRDLSAV